MKLITKNPEVRMSSVVSCSFPKQIAYCGGSVEQGICQSTGARLSLRTPEDEERKAPRVVTSIVSLGPNRSNIVSHRLRF